MTYVRTSTGPENAVRELTARGVSDPEQLLRFASPEAIVGACGWFDSLAGNPGLGVLANAIKAGGKPDWQPPKPRSTLGAQQAYGEKIVERLREHFPQWNKPDGNRTHPAAIAAVIRLHWLYGKDVAVLEHGGAIRAAVTTWDGK